MDDNSSAVIQAEDDTVAHLRQLVDKQQRRIAELESEVETLHRRLRLTDQASLRESQPTLPADHSSNVGATDAKPTKRRLSDAQNVSSLPGDQKNVVKKRSPSPLLSYPLNDLLPGAKKEEIKDEDGRIPKKRRVSMKMEVYIDAPSSRVRARSRRQSPSVNRAPTPTILHDSDGSELAPADFDVVEDAVHNVSPTPAPSAPSVKPEPMDDLPLPTVRESSPAFAIPKVKKNRVFDAATVQDRINAIGRDPYPIDLDLKIMRVTVTRRFMSNVYGGSGQSTFPRIKKTRVDKHGYDGFMYLPLDKHPHAPHLPGHPGLFFLEQPEEAYETEYRTFTGIGHGKWLYVGQYKMSVAKNLSREEWLLQSDSIRKAWSHELMRYEWGSEVRARVIFRPEIGCEPADDEISALLADKGNKFSDITPEEIMQAFDKGEQVLGIHAMKCVGYDLGFQRELAQKFPVWVPPPKKIKEKKVVATRRSSGKSRAVASDVEIIEPEVEELSSDEESESDGGGRGSRITAEELRYNPRGTKSRPKQGL